MDLQTLSVAGVTEWRSWLSRNHLGQQGVWLLFPRKGAAGKSITYQEAVDEALAYGWIDSVIKRVNSQTYTRKFTPRRPGSIWSKTNIDRVERLKAAGRMAKPGLEAFAKRTGEVSLLEKFNAEGVKTPKDLEDALKGNRTAWANYQKFAPSYRKRYLIWISGAKRPETRQKRVSEAVHLISRNVKELLK